MSRIVSSDMTVNEAVRQCPQSIHIFMLAGIDTSRGGRFAIMEAARRNGVDETDLMAAIDALDCDDEASNRLLCGV